jgi:hypothetical protein
MSFYFVVYFKWYVLEPILVKRVKIDVVSFEKMFRPLQLFLNNCGFTKTNGMHNYSNKFKILRRTHRLMVCYKKPFDGTILIMTRVTFPI